MSRKKLSHKTKTILGVCIPVGIIVLLVLIFSFFMLYNFIKKDYKQQGRIDYLSSVSEKGAANEKKNVVLILVDDMGYGDLSFTGSEAISTPNIDKLAQDGIFFDNYYSPNPICSASRAGLLTGRYPLRTLTCGAYMDTETIGGHFSSLLQCILGTYPYWNTGLPTDEILLPEALQSVGYNTALFGKWHLGVKKGELPNDRGFDYFFGALYSDDMDPYRVYENYDVVHYEPYDQTQLTKELTSGILDYIDEEAGSNEPFFLYYASPFPHWPAQVSEDYAGTSEGGTYGDCMQEIDWSVGEIMDELEEQGILDDTLVLFTSDNGPWYEGATGGQRGRKATKFNGGSHVPLIAYMNGTLATEGGVVDHDLTSGLDIFPTILSMVGVDLPTDRIIDGYDMWSVWLSQGTGEELSCPRTRIYINDDKDSFAMIEIRDVVVDGETVKKQFKYLERSQSENSHYWNLKQGPFLYDMEVDYEEAYDVTSHFEDVASTMADELNEFKASLKSNVRGWIED